MGKPKLTEMEYTTIKQLLDKGYDGQKVASIVGRGRGAVSRVNCTGSYEEYRTKTRAERIRYKMARLKPRQLPLKPKNDNTTIDLRQSIVIKLSALYDEVILYKRTPTGKTNEELRDIAMAVAKLEEAEMWLKRHW